MALGESWQAEKTAGSIAGSRGTWVAPAVPGFIEYGVKQVRAGTRTSE